MSYSALSFGATDCPAGWTRDPATGDCKSPADVTQCPPQFSQRTPGECWPATDTACKDTFGTFFNPAEPDRCKKQCPSGLDPDSNNVCRPKTIAASLLSSPSTVGMLILGAVAVTIVIRGGLR